MARLGKKFFKVLKSIDKLCKFKASLLRHSHKWKNEREVAVRLIDRALKYSLTSAIYSIRDLIRNEQNSLYKLLVPDRQHKLVKFDFQLEFDHNGNVVPQPSFEDYTIHIMNLYDSIRKTVVNEKIVEEFLFDLVAIAKEEIGKKTGYCVNPTDYIKRRSFSKYEKDIVEKAIGNNIK